MKVAGNGLRQCVLRQWGMSMVGRKAIGRLAAALLVGTALVAVSAPVMAQSTASTAELRSFNIAPQPLASALTLFGRQAGLQVSSSAANAASVSSPGVVGDLAPADALSRLLSGTGLTFSFTASGTVIVAPAGASELQQGYDGSIVLEEVNVSAWVDGASMPVWDGSAETVYSTPGSVSAISEETISRFRGTAPADLLKGIPGLFSGENKASGGMDVNVRGMQGMGRVPVTVDGANNTMNVYRGYQGIGNRSFVDPDFISDVAVEKGPSSGAGGSGAIGGSVKMSTISADDIVPEGESIGLRLRIGASNNTTAVGAAPKTNAIVPVDVGLWGITEPLETASLLDFTSGSASATFGLKTEYVDFVAGLSRRATGNYHAGTTGDGAVESLGERNYCEPNPYYGEEGPEFYCSYHADTYGELPLTAYLPGEEVLNTSSDTTSSLYKMTIRPAPDHSLELGYAKYDSSFGETYPMGFFSNEHQKSQGRLSTTSLSRYTARYNWNPADELIDFSANAWATRLDDASIADAGNFSVSRKWSEARGFDLSNTSRFEGDLGTLALTYGADYSFEATAPVLPLSGIPPRFGERTQASAFVNGSYSPTEWLTVLGGVRHHAYEAINTYPGLTFEPVTGSATDFSAGVAVEPVDGLQLFATYKEASRLPSLFESVGGFATIVDPDLGPERAHNWEVGANYQTRDLITAGDEVGLKLAYFDNNITDYINRRWDQSVYMMKLGNIASARFIGLEASARYSANGFTADLGGTYYTGVEFCRTEDTCVSESLHADYATNQIPPKFSASLTLSQQLLDDRLTIGGRISHVGGRAVDAGPGPNPGASPFIAPIVWKPHTIVDVFADYKLNETTTLNVSVENLMDVYYVDPLNLALMPSPGRTIKVGLTGEFSPGGGGYEGFGGLSPSHDWTGLYIGGHVGGLTGIVETDSFLGNPVMGNIDSASIGAQAGYNLQTEGGLVFGVEALASGANAKLSSATIQSDATLSAELSWQGTVRARAGFAMDRLLAYGHVGYTAASVELGGDISNRWEQSTTKGTEVQHGLSLGAGAEYALTDELSVRADYTFADLEADYDGVYSLTTGKTRLEQVTVGLNYRF